MRAVGGSGRAAPYTIRRFLQGPGAQRIAVSATARQRPVLFIAGIHPPADDERRACDRAQDAKAPRSAKNIANLRSELPCQPLPASARYYSLPVFTHQLTMSAAPVTAPRMPRPREAPRTSQISAP